MVGLHGIDFVKPQTRLGREDVKSRRWCLPAQCTAGEWEQNSRATWHVGQSFLYIYITVGHYVGVLLRHVPLVPDCWRQELGCVAFGSRQRLRTTNWAFNQCAQVRRIAWWRPCVSGQRLYGGRCHSFLDLILCQIVLVDNVDLRQSIAGRHHIVWSKLMNKGVERRTFD